MFSTHNPLPVHKSLLPCPTCETAVLCRTDRGAQRSNEAFTILLCPACGVYHSMTVNSAGCTLNATPVEGSI